MFGRPVLVGTFFAVCLTATVIGCSQNAGSPVAPILAGGAPSATPVRATPTPGQLGSSGVNMGSPCTFLALGSGATPPPVTVPGNYTAFISEGFVSGSVYEQSEGEWLAFSVSGTPVPTPVPTATAAPTPVPSGAATPISFDVYTGQYSIPGYTAFVSPGPSSAPSAAPTTFEISPTVGCALLIVTADRSVIPEGEAGQINSESIGVPNFGDGAFFGESGQVLTELEEGNLTTFTLNNLTSSGGNATFFLDGDPDSGGSASFGPAQVFTEAQLRALKAQFVRYQLGSFRHR